MMKLKMFTIAQLSIAEILMACLKRLKENSKIVDEARQEILALKQNASKDAKDYLQSLREEAQGYINKC